MRISIRSVVGRKRKKRSLLSHLSSWLETFPKQTCFCFQKRIFAWCGDSGAVEKKGRTDRIVNNNNNNNFLSSRNPPVRLYVFNVKNCMFDQMNVYVYFWIRWYCSRCFVTWAPAGQHQNTKKFSVRSAKSEVFCFRPLSRGNTKCCIRDPSGAPSKTIKPRES